MIIVNSEEMKAVTLERFDVNSTLDGETIEGLFLLEQQFQKYRVSNFHDDIMLRKKFEEAKNQYLEEHKNNYEHTLFVNGKAFYRFVGAEDTGKRMFNDICNALTSDHLKVYRLGGQV